ncbi:C39 family peptidase [Paenibacillus sp. FSL R5-0486]|uniref:C39 family peptidase n=1 Tax=Paenibacillus sp. FSL R5-0486 TaxID=2921645 RepID=UPI0030D6DF64
MFLNVLLWLIILWVISLYFSFPKKDRMYTVNVPSTYYIQSSNRLDIQKNYECAAFSSAFVLRHFGLESNGTKLYETYPRKLLDGTVYPKAVVVFFRKLGYQAMYLRGNVNTLKKQISQGVPVILFIRVHPKQRYLHFVPVVGYDETHFYLAESLDHKINCDEEYYNRKISINELNMLWRSWLPFSQNSYIVVHPMQI